MAQNIDDIDSQGSTHHVLIQKIKLPVRHGSDFIRETSCTVDIVMGTVLLDPGAGGLSVESQR